MIKDMKTSEIEICLQVADLMVTAAKTAPKASGKDKIVAFVLSGKDKHELCETMRKLAIEYKQEFIKRDADNIDASHCIVIIGVKSEPFGLSQCKLCGFDTCSNMKKADANCTLNITDLGIAIGSAVSIAADNRIDNRVMYSAGKGALNMNFMPEDVKVAFGIPLSASSKNIFFDRSPENVIDLD